MTVNVLILLVCLVTVADVLAAPPPDEVKLSKAEQQFSTELFQTIAAESSYTKNVFFSPYSIFKALLLVYVASAGETEKSLEKFLRFDESSKPDKNYIADELVCDVPECRVAPEEYELNSLERIFHIPEVKVKSDKEQKFSDLIVVFKTKDDREDEVNNWISNITKGMIQNALEKGTLEKNLSMVVVNAAYFKGYWTNSLTGKAINKPFTLAEGTESETQFMSAKEGDLFQSMTDEELKAQILFLPYKGDDISMIIILPTTKPTKNAPSPLADVVKKLTNTKFQKIVSSLLTQQSCTTDLLIPKFKSEDKYQLKPIFEALGDKDLFSQELNLTNIFDTCPTPSTEDCPKLFVDKIVHQARVNVYENGTEAAAATEVIIHHHPGPMPLPDPLCPTTFHADHPFVYIIYDKRNRFVHYMGVLNTPKQQ